VVLILYGGSRVLAGTSTPGDLIAFIGAFLLAYEPLKRMAKVTAQLNAGLAGASRIFALLDSAPSIVDRPGAKPLVIREAGIRLRDVDFAYDPQKPALRGVSLEVPAGRTVALVGPSGAGKSTILNLIPRFYDVEGGAVLIDGQDVREVTLDSLRGAIALVSQEVSLFDDTIRANIAYGQAGATQEAVERAAVAAAAHDFITGLPQGYDTMVGEHGVKLSGGQRQRIAIARAMLRDAPILLLDEATSALDTESERAVQEALNRLRAGRTTLVIAHRLSTIVDADIICAMEAGRVVESGSHAELLARGGLYARLYGQQAETERGDHRAAI
ncbi:MAG TPA: ATP-binding cassette domain-containing protein, partial [Alphaproteobacteria bacterium]|nr:ATP-binding cassette domain-containing protein [Alphaproteobacteria bacterium]